MLYSWRREFDRDGGVHDGELDLVVLSIKGHVLAEMYTRRYGGYTYVVPLICSCG